MHGTLIEFVSKEDVWQSFVERMKQYFAGNKIVASEKKTCSSCGRFTYYMIKDIVSPRQLTFNKIVILMWSITT